MLIAREWPKKKWPHFWGHIQEATNGRRCQEGQARYRPVRNGSSGNDA